MTSRPQRAQRNGNGSWPSDSSSVAIYSVIPKSRRIHVRVYKEK